MSYIVTDFAPKKTKDTPGRVNIRIVQCAASDRGLDDMPSS